MLMMVAAGFLNPAYAQGVLTLNLGGSWQVSKVGDPEMIPATVPGCIHTDLLAAGKIPDPYFGDNEKKVQWVSNAAWVYRRSFDVAADLLAHERVLLRCEGLDTLATIMINGSKVGRTDNMFRTYEFDVRTLLRPGTNSIEVRFDSVLPYIQAREKERHLPTWAYPGSGYIRKEPCNFGWDWGPTLITCGIWKTIGLVAFNTGRIDDVMISQDHSKPGTVGLKIDVAADAFGSDKLKFKASASLAGKAVGSASDELNGGKGKTVISISNPKLWWPAGMGSQPLYTVKVELLDAGGKLLDTATRRIGLRVMKVYQKAADAPMQFKVNGVMFFAKGANWIPADNFPNRIPKGTLHRYIEDAVAANMNTLRFWGGGRYEEDELFDACDELGICIWLDFKFACSTYPAFDESFLNNVKQETRDNLRRLRHHPSLAVLCGNNEIMFFRDKTWSDKKMGEEDYYKLFRDTLGGQVKKFAPQVDYVTGSPDCGDEHFWGVWHGGKPFEAYRNVHGFVSEFGFQSFPGPKTVQAFTGPADRNSAYSETMLYHMRSGRMYMDGKENGRIGTDKLMKLVNQYFKKPKDFESTLWLSQINQGFGIKYGAESWRRDMPRSMGCVYWQYNDIWPGSSWSSVDYFGRWKALHYMARRFYAPLLVSGLEEPRSGTVDVYVTSDRRESCSGNLSWRVTDLAGKKVKSGSVKVEIMANSSRQVHSLLLKEEIQKLGANNMIVWLALDVAGKRESDNMVTFVYPKELDLVDPKLSADIAEKKGQFVVTLNAQHPALWTWLELDGEEARYSDNFVHVTRECPVAITVTPARPMSREAFQKALKMRSLIDTYRPPPAPQEIHSCAPQSGIPLCGVVDTNRVLVDFARDRPDVTGTQTKFKLDHALELTFGERGGFATLKVPERDGWNLDAYVAVAVDLKNTGTKPVTLLGKINNNTTCASLAHLEPGEADTLVLFLFRKGHVTRFEGMNGAPGGDIHFWGGYERMVVKDMEFCDLDGQAAGGKVEITTIRAIGKHLELNPAGDVFFPFVDRFGQYRHASWPNKVSTENDIKVFARNEAAALKAHPRCADWDKFGGWAGGPKREATGHFRTEKVNGKWWLVDPEGALFWSIGVNGVGFGSATRVQGRERYFSSIPEAGLRKGGVDFTVANSLLKYGPDWHNTSIALTHARLSSWGMNTCGNWSDKDIYLTHKTPYVVAVHLGEKKGAEAIATRGNETALREALKRALAKHAESAEDPWCLGYFIDNELNWKFVPDIDMYFRVVKEEMALAAPKKLYLGSRIHNGNREALEASAKYCDVVSINCYEHSPAETPLDKPYLIGEFHFGALDRGMLATGLRSASNQRQRANSYKHYMLEAIKRPNIVGAHWFTFHEQPVTGRGDGENYQIGLVDICDTPYSELVSAIRETGESLYRLRNTDSK